MFGTLHYVFIWTGTLQLLDLRSNVSATVLTECHLFEAIFIHTVPSESIQIPWLFPNFVTLQPKMDFFSSAIYTRYPIMTKQKCFGGKFLQMYKNKYLHSIQTLCYETQNWAQVHPVSIDHPWDISTTPPVVNSIDWTWFRKAHACLYKVPQLTEHVGSKKQAMRWRNCP